MLMKNGFSVGSAGIDGKFGTDTRSAVLIFQRQQNLSVDGVVGAQTRTA